MGIVDRISGRRRRSEAPPAPPIGWRDEPVEGPEKCHYCDGWGSRRKWVRIPASSTRAGHLYRDAGLDTCGFCHGTGRSRPAA